MNVCGYVRVSLETQASDKHYSIPEQTDRIQAYCKAKGWNLVHIYTDAGYSGKSLDRPAMQQLIAECTMYDLVLVNKLDRLSRSQKDTLYLIEDVFRAHNVQFASMSENFDTTTPLGMAMVGILSVFAQLEREQIKERMHMGRVGRVKKGLWHTTGKPPIGYDYVDGHLVINESEAEQVRIIYDMFLAGNSFHAISRFMHENYVNKYSSWNQTNSVSAVIQDPLYIGKVRFDGQFYDGEHEPIIDEETFNKAQTRYALISRGNTHYQNAFKASHLLTGLLFCGNCGSRYSVSVSHTKIKGKDYKNVYYGCRGRFGTNQEKMKSNHCKNRYIREIDLNSQIINEVMKLDISEVTPKKKKKPIIDHSKEIAKIDGQISKLIDLYTVAGISIDDVSKKIAALNDKKAKLSQSNTVETERVSPDIVSAKEILMGDDMEKKRVVLASLIQKIVIYDDSIEIFWNF